MSRSSLCTARTSRSPTSMRLRPSSGQPLLPSRHPRRRSRYPRHRHAHVSSRWVAARSSSRSRSTSPSQMSSKPAPTWAWDSKSGGEKRGLLVVPMGQEVEWGACDGQVYKARQGIHCRLVQRPGIDPAWAGTIFALKTTNLAEPSEKWPPTNSTPNLRAAARAEQTEQTERQRRAAAEVPVRVLLQLGCESGAESCAKELRARVKAARRASALTAAAASPAGSQSP